MISSKARQIQISSSAIFFASLIGVAIWVTVGALGSAIGMSIGPEKIPFPSDALLAVIGIVTIAMLSSAFFVAGFVASKVSHQEFRFDSIIHSLSAWALMAVLLTLMVMFAAASDNMRRSLSGTIPIALVTDIQVLEGKAVTTFKGGESKAAQEKSTPEEKKSNKVFTLAFWVCFISLLLGAGGAVAGGLLARQRIPKLE